MSRRTMLAARVVAGALIVAVALVVVGAAGGCTARVPGEPRSAAHELVRSYFDAVNAAASRGSATQQRLFAGTQHPDFRAGQCSLPGLTVTADPAYSTVRMDPDWRPPDADEPPRGTIYVVAVTLTVRRGTELPGGTEVLGSTEVVGSQVGTMHVVVLDGIAYGFAPCPA